MPRLDEVAPYVGDTPPTSIYLGGDEEPTGGTSASPLQGAVVSEDYRSLNAFPPGGWEDNYEPTDAYLKLSDWVFSAEGAMHPGPLPDATTYSGYRGQNMYHTRFLPDGFNIRAATYVYHLKFGPLLLPRVAGGYENLELTLIHDPEWEWDFEQAINLDQLGSDISNYSYSNDSYASSNGVDLGAGDLAGIEMVVLTWIDPDGLQTRVIGTGIDVTDTAVWDTYDPVEYLSLGNMKMQTSTNADPEAGVGHSPYTFKGFYVLPAPSSTEEATAIAAYLLS